MFDNVKNLVRGIATERQSKREKGVEVLWKRDAKGNLVDESGIRVAGNLENGGTDDENA